MNRLVENSPFLLCEPLRLRRQKCRKALFGRANQLPQSRSYRDTGEVNEQVICALYA
jgi:hypothetical protein